MRFFMARRRLRNSIGGLVAVGLFAALASWQHIAADDPTEADEQLANELEVTVPRRLRVAERHTYSIKVKIKSKSVESLPGPIYLVVQGTGIDALVVENADAATAGDEPFFRFLAGTDEPLPSKSSITRTIRFKSDGALRSRDRRQFKLDYRLTRNVSMAKKKAADRKRDRRPRRSPGFSGPGNRGSKNGNRPSRSGNRGANNDSKPNLNDGDQRENPRHEPFTLKPGITGKQVKKVMKIQDAWTPRLMKKAGVRGTATGVNAKGDLVIRIYTSRHGIAKNLPESIEGIPVEPRVVGRFRLMFAPPQDKRGNAGRPRFNIPEGDLVLNQEPPIVDDPQQRFDRPIPIGVSGISTNVGCSAGTIGSRVVADDGSLYALSNNHVFAAENAGIIGDPIVHPSPADNGCDPDIANNTIGNLAAFVPVVINDPSAGNFVDGALASVTADNVGNSTPRGAYGTPNSTTIEAILGMKVQKMGRTTSHTTGRVTALNVFVPIPYGGGVGFFTGQIEITNPIFRIDDETGEVIINLEVFSAGGDSGSLIVTTYGHNPVGLLFAGSLFFTLANPIDIVLEQLGAEVGKELRIDNSR